MSDIFISYSYKDREFVQKICSDLSNHGHKIWLDEWEIKVGDPVFSKIEDGLSKADYVIIILSSNFVQSSWTKIEYYSAYYQEVIKNKIVILPVLISDCDIPLILINKKYADFRYSYETGFSELSAAISSHGKNNKRKKKNVWYLDDNINALHKFQDRHKEHFNICIFNNVVELLENIQKTSSNSIDFPDIVLIDLYAPLSEFEVNRKLLEETNQKLSLFFEMEKELKKYVDDAWKPYGVDIIISVKEYYSSEEFQIVLYTQRGLVLLDDELIRELETLHVKWLLKKQFSAETERLILNKIMMYGNCRVTHGKKHIVFIDDNPEFQKIFIDRHGRYYDIECINDQGEVIPTIEKMKLEGRFPDLLLSDLYYPIGTDEKSMALIDKANRKLLEFHEFESELKKLVKQTHEPIGVKVIKEIRGMYKEHELPIMIYTQTGLLLLDDSMIQKVEALGTGWLLKNRYSHSTEQTKIFGQIIQSNRKSCLYKK